MRGEGCAVCLAAAAGEYSPEFKTIAISPVGWILIRCGVCGTLWQSDERRFWIIDDAEARQQFPGEYP